MKTVSLTINGNKITVPEGSNLLQASLDNGLYIPNLCAIRDNLNPMAACRLCFVEIAGRDKPVTACTETVIDGMIVNTMGQEAHKLVRYGFELLMASHTIDCAHCSSNGTCELQNIARHLRIKLKPDHLRKLEHDFPIDTSHPTLIYDANKCVLCGQCIAACQEYSNSDIFGFAHRGFERRVTTFQDEPIGTSECNHCTRCADVCPTGALVKKTH